MDGPTDCEAGCWCGWQGTADDVEDHSWSLPDHEDGDRVEVPYPATIDAGSVRDEWPWMPGTILGPCDDAGREWHIRVDVDELAEQDGGEWY